MDLQHFHLPQNNKPIIIGKSAPGKAFTSTDALHQLLNSCTNLTSDECHQKEHDGIYLEALCEYTGIHYHQLVVFLVQNQEITKLKTCTAHIDGSISYPRYNDTIIELIQKLREEYPNRTIYVHERIKTKGFHDYSYQGGSGLYKESCGLYRK